jgi:hypothetical protein
VRPLKELSKGRSGLGSVGWYLAERRHNRIFNFVGDGIANYLETGYLL